MKVRLIAVSMLVVLMFFCIGNAFALEISTFDSFQSYSLGNTSFKGNWVPQYYSRVSISQDLTNKFLRIDSYVPFEGDRDVHVAFNKTFNYPAVPNRTAIRWDFFSEKCNPYWKNSEGVSPQAASLYLGFKDPSNFVSVEFKLNATSNSCGQGLGQVAIFKRVNGIAIPLNKYTVVPITTGKNYVGMVALKRIGNSEDYKIRVYLDNLLISESFVNISLRDFRDGKVLLENGGTITRFDNFYFRGSY